MTTTQPAPAPSMDLLHAMARDVRNSELERIAGMPTPHLDPFAEQALRFRDAARLRDLQESLFDEASTEEFHLRTTHPTVPAPPPENDGWARLRESEQGERRSADFEDLADVVGETGRSTWPPATVSSSYPRDRSDSRPSVTSSGAVHRDALDLVTRRSRPPSSPGLSLAREMEEREALGDFTGALRVALLVLGRKPDHRDAQRCADACRAKLIQLSIGRLAGLAGVAADRVGGCILHLAVAEQDVRWLGLDHRQGFVLSRIDEMSSVDDMVDLCAMPRLEVLQTLVELVDAGVVRIWSA